MKDHQNRQLLYEPQGRSQFNYYTYQTAKIQKHPKTNHIQCAKTNCQAILVGGFNASEKY
jgi:hypothetical protein